MLTFSMIFPAFSSLIYEKIYSIREDETHGYFSYLKNVLTVSFTCQCFASKVHHPFNINSHNYFSIYNLALPKICSADRDIFLKLRSSHAIFLFTNVLLAPHQLQGKCAKNKSYSKANQLQPESVSSWEQGLFLSCCTPSMKNSTEQVLQKYLLN